MTAQATIDALRAKAAQMQSRAGTLVPDGVVVPQPPVPPIVSATLATLVPNTARNLASYVNPHPDWAVRGRNITDYSSIVADPARKRVLLFGGSHGPSQETDIRSLATDTGVWSSLYPSTLLADMLPANMDKVLGRWINTNQPVARHTYRHRVVRAERLYLMTAYCNPDNLPRGALPAFTGRLCWYDFVTRAWTYSAKQQPWHFDSASCLDPISQNIYVVGLVGGTLAAARIWKYDPVADTIAQGPLVGVNKPDFAYCPLDDAFYAFEGSGGVVRRIVIDRVDLSKTTSTVLTTTGSPPPAVASPYGYASFAWDGARFGGHVVANAHYAFDPVTREWSATPIQIEAGSVGPAGHVFFCSTFDAASGCYIFLQSPGTAKTWAYRSEALSPPVTPPPASTIVRTPVNLSRLLTLRWQFARTDTRYDRFDKHKSVTTISVPFDCCDASRKGGGAKLPFLCGRYGMLVDGVERATATVAKGVASTGTFTGPLGSEPDDVDHLAVIVGYDAAGNIVERSQPYVFAIDRNGQAKLSDKVAKQNGTFLWERWPPGSLPEHHYVVLRKADVLQDYPNPLPPRPAVDPFDIELPPVQLARVNLVPSVTPNDQNWNSVAVTNAGVVVTANTQRYSHQLFLEDKFPRVPLLDGPRGVCTAPFTLEVMGGREGKAYGLGAWSIYVIDSTGTKRTLAGLRHRSKLDVHYWETPATSVHDPRLEVVGTWIGIPDHECYPWEPWFLLKDRRSLLLDMNAPPIDGEQPHLPYQLPSGEWIYGPRFFFGDKHHGGRVVEIRTGGPDGKDRRAPWVMRPWIDNIGDPWGGCDCEADNTFAVAARADNEIAEWSMDYPNTKVHQLLYSPGASAVGTVGKIGQDDRRRYKYFSGQSIATARMHDVCGPESLRRMDSKYTFGSLAQAEVREFDRVTGGIKKNRALPDCNRDGVGAFWVAHGVSDGSFFPRHTLFTGTFSNKPSGYPQAWRPDGSKMPFRIGTEYGIVRGPGGQWDDSHYPICVSNPHEGRLWVSDSGGGGLSYHCKADAYDGPLPTSAKYAQLTRGYDYYRRMGYNTIHGPNVTSQTGPLPWGENADMDAWFEHLWFVKP